MTSTAAELRAPEAAPHRPSLRHRVEGFALDYGVLVATIALAIFLSFKSEYFLTTANLLNIGNFTSAVGIIVVVMTISAISGQLDLSVGAQYALASVALARFVESYHLPLFVGILATFGICWLVAVANSFLVISLKIDPIVATLGTGIVGGALAVLWEGGNLIFLSGRSDFLVEATNSRPLGIPLPMIILLLVIAFGWVLMNLTRIGAHIYAVGGNPTAASRAGISSTRILVCVLFLSSTATALAALIDTGRLAFTSSAAPITGSVVAAVLMGGVGLAGGSGKVQRAVFGILLMGVMNNGLTLLNVDAYSIFLYQALVLLIAVAFAGLATKSTVR